MKKLIVFAVVLLSVLFPAGAQENSSTVNLKPIYIFTGTEGLQGTVVNDYMQFLTLDHTVFGSIELPLSVYTFGVWIEDAFSFDVTGMGDDIPFTKMISNSLSAGIDNTLFLKNLFYGNINFYANYVLPNYQYKALDYSGTEDVPYLVLNPLLKAGGMYDSGFDWEIEQDFTVKTLLDTGDTFFNPATTVSLSYEFFRVSGPEDFRISVKVLDTLMFSMPFAALFEDDEETESEGEGAVFVNNIRAGLVFNFNSADIAVSFLNNITGNTETEALSLGETGFSVSASYIDKQITYSAGYTGYMRNSGSSSLWISNFIISWSINIDSIILADNE